MPDEKKADDKSNDKGSPKKPGASSPAQILDDLYEKFKQVSGFGIIGLLAYLFFKNQKGKELLKAAASLTKAGIDWTGTEFEPLFAHLKGWAIDEVQKFEQAIKIAIGTLVATGAIVVISTAFIHPMLWKAVAALGSSFIIMYVLHTQFVRVWPLLMVFGLVDGTLQAGEKFELTKAQVQSFPGMLIGGLRRGGREGLGWIGSTWRKIALTCVWFTAGDIYITITQLHLEPALIFLGLMTVPILTFIPLALPYKKDEERGSQFNTLMYICGFILLDIFIWCNLYDSIQVVMRHPNPWVHFFGRLGIVLTAVVEIGISIYLALRMKPKKNQAEASQINQYGTTYRPAAPMPHNNVGWIVSGIVVLFFFLTVTWIACNGALPGFPKADPALTVHRHEQVARQNQAKAEMKLKAARRQLEEANSQVDSVNKEKESINQSPGAIH